MNALFASGRAIDLVLAVVALEFFLLVARRRKTNAGPGALEIFAQLLAGALLLGALRCALTGAGPLWIAAFLAASFPAHLFDLSRRFRRVASPRD